MCTSITLNTNDDYHFLARTFDFDSSVNETIFVVPRQYKLSFSLEYTLLSKYAFIGMGMIKESNHFFYDGINEKGLMCASLYLENTKVNIIDNEKFNISIDSFVSWVLSQFESIDEIIKNIDYINIICDKAFEGGQCHPVHWIVTDSTSRTIIIEKRQQLVVYDGELGVLANYPGYKWQLRNLQCYNCINPHDESIGLPGDTSSPTRFVRAAYMKKYLEKNLSGEINGISAAFRILDTVAVQKGMDFDEEKYSYTHTITCMCSQSLIYYCYTYNNRQIQAFSLQKKDLNSTSIKEYSIIDNQSINYRN